MEITLKFPTILQLVDFQLVTATQNFSVDTVHTTITGPFSEADVELARHGFDAHPIDNHKSEIHSNVPK